MNLILKFHNNVSGAKEPGSAACGKPDSRPDFIKLNLL
ncbi:hypothetical protein LEP1GSC127_4451 [Leptospira kirschneri str. 200801925]|uniref:Uncharacterized protein n=1 Tax=Leptospira kirschneri str. 200802841 TaxID=1193047 RepID=A0A828XXD8_9LEPT|nr:hypothetical protein LEP1GSC131_4280 [Leptospira kirschneri str. 200802841]EMO76429.1 hypothetical protein LEP1GSC127_4451 [Leptospira kirschneri str. 200801925]